MLRNKYGDMRSRAAANGRWLCEGTAWSCMIVRYRYRRHIVAELAIVDRVPCQLLLNLIDPLTPVHLLAHQPACRPV